jgi:hypothetical protein
MSPATLPVPVPSPSLEFCLRLTRAYATLTRRLDNALGSVHSLSFGTRVWSMHWSSRQANSSCVTPR